MMFSKRSSARQVAGASSGTAPPLVSLSSPQGHAIRGGKDNRQLKIHSTSAPLEGTALPGLMQKLGRVLKEKAAGDFERFFKGTTKTRERLGLVDELLAFWTLEDYETTLEELEDALITADFGPKTALKIVDKVRDAIKGGKVTTSDDLRAQLKASIVDLLNGRGQNSELNLTGSPSVVFIVGVNGAGKTTTIGKLAAKFGGEGAKVFLIPGDTFRAAAAEQLAEWGRRSGAVMGTFTEGSRPMAVIAECLKEASDRKGEGKIDIVVCDTAGRLHTAYALMEELQACKAAIGKALPGQPDETLLVLDGTTGLNMLNQAREFNESVKLTGLILTKLDGTARGGAVVSVVDQIGVPVKFIGVGETTEDLQTFNAENFAEALFPAMKKKA